MYSPGDVVLVRSAAAGKPKYHLCVSLNGCYLFLNSYKSRDYPGNIVVPCTAIPFLAPTPTGQSVICCSVVLRLSAFEQGKAIFKGRVSRALLRMIVDEVESSEVLTEIDRETVLAGLDDWI